MKVLQIINTLATGGAEKLLLDALPQYGEKGATVDLLLLNGKPQPFLDALLERDCCAIFTLGNGSVYNPMHIFRLIPMLRRYDIVHVHLFPALYWVALAKLLSFSRTKLVYTEHCTTNARMQKTFWRFLDRFMYARYDKIVCISDEVQQAIAEYSGVPEKLTRIENGVDLSRIFKAEPYLKRELGLPVSDSDVLLLQVSRFQAQKDQPTAIRALSHLPANVHLLLVGEGELKRENEQLAESLGLTDRVHFLGLRMDVPRLLKTADVVLLSSHFEGLSLSSIEGMASGKPFLASDVPGLTEVVSGAGVLFPESDEKALAAAVARLIDDAAHRESVAKTCLERASAYDIGFMTDKHIRLYKALHIFTYG